ncbi:substrate-binding domain-containing protein [Comamonas testosteroni]|uniref:substrate-binding domain-containing protein n=1 Tax=Comamonas testosteroni TaxID=285 RepID=UPI0038999BC5
MLNKCFAATIVAILLAAPAVAQDRLVGLVQPIKAAKPFRIGVAVVHLQDDFYKGIVYGIEDEAKRVGAEVVQVSVAGAYGNVREQFAQLEALKALKVDVVAFSAASFNGYDNALKSLKDAGIKVAAVGIPVGSKSIDFGILQDDKEIGKTLAAEICKNGKPGKVLTVPGAAGAEWARLRYVGFMDEAKKCQGLQAIEGAFGGAINLQHGMTQTSDLLLRHPDAKYVYTPQVSLGMGAAQAIRQQRKDVKVVSSSMVKEAIPMVKDGRFLGIVSEPGIIMGRLTVQLAARQLAGQPTPELKAADASSPYPYFNVPPVLITPANVEKHPFGIYEIPPENWKLPTVR